MSASTHRLLLVHAHPDDESITTGATMAYYAAQGAAVTLLTCTLGEEGEILVPRVRAARGGAGRPARRAAHRRAGRRDGGARRRRSPLPRRGRALPRQRHDGHAGQRAPAGRSGGPTPDPDVFDAAVAAAVERHPRGAAAGDRHLRRQRRLRPPRPRHGPPGGHRRGRTRRRRRLRRGPAVGRGEVLLDRRPRSRCCARDSRRCAAAPTCRSTSPRSTTCRSGSTTTSSPPTIDATDFVAAKTRRAGRAPHPGRRRRRVLRAVEQAGPRDQRGGALPAGAAASSGPSATPTAARPICSRGWS